ncbi:MAG: rRNA maturation RNase YbeY [Nitrospiraceae bacterium]
MPVVRRFDKAHRRLRSPQVFIRSRLRRYRLVQAEVRRLAQRILTQVSRGQAPADAWLRREPVPCELSLDFVGDRRMRRLNREYRGRDLPTDVLAFPMRHSLRVTRDALRVTPHEMLGDVAISLHTAARHAAADRRAVDHELARLLIHGILHLVGYDHERGGREARRMRRKERAILRALKPLPKLVGKVKRDA